MKKYFLLPVLILCIYYVDAQNHNEEQRVNKTISDFFNGFSTRDINTIKKYSTADFLLLEDAMIWNIDTIANHFEMTKARGINFIRKNSFDFLRTEIKGNTAWVAYHNTAEISLGERKRTVRWLESAVLIKRDNAWKIQMMHSTPVKEQKEN